MYPLTTNIKYEEYKKFFQNVALVETSWISLLRPAIQELKNEDLCIFIIAIDNWTLGRIHTSSKFSATHIAFMQEYIKRVENFKIMNASLQKQTEENNKRARERLNKYREELSKDPTYTGIPPELDFVPVPKVDQDLADFIDYGLNILSKPYSFVDSPFTLIQLIEDMKKLEERMKKKP